MFCARALRVAIVAALVVRVGLFAGNAYADAAEAKKIFTTRCTACHTFGKGVKVGPDLKGVNERRQRPWLLKFVRSSSTVIASADPIATALFTEFKQQRMPDWSDLSEEQVGSILDWLGINGPEQQEPDTRLAELASAAEIDTGRQLFHGGRPMINGGSACATCHSIHDEGHVSGGTLAQDLTTKYSEFQDVAMTLFLKHPCFLRYPESISGKFLTPEESFAIKAYLRQAALTAQPASAGLPTVTKPVESASSQGSATPPAAGTSRPVRRVTWSPPEGRPAIVQAHAKHIQGVEGQLLFRVFPYAALLVLILGLGIRLGLARRQPEAIRPAGKDAWHVFGGSAAWRVGIVVTLIVHLLIVLAPSSILSWNGSSSKLYLLEATSFLLGLVAFVGWLQMMGRHLGRTTKSAGAGLADLADVIFLSVLCMAIVSGLITAAMYRWGSSWGAETVAPYMTSLGHGAPATALIEEMPFLVRFHVFTWFVVIALVPFTSVSMLLVPGIDRFLMLLARPIGEIGGMGRRTVARLSPARWLWPEEDVVDITGGGDNPQKPS
jgi:nitrate reductase gamma subunit